MISRLNAARDAVEIAKMLHRLHGVWLSRAAFVRGAASFTTVQMRNLHGEAVATRQRLVDFGTAHGTYFTNEYPPEAAALQPAVQSLAAIRDAIASLAPTYTQNGKLTDEEVAQADRDMVAAAIEAELEL